MPVGRQNFIAMMNFALGNLKWKQIPKTYLMGMCATSGDCGAVVSATAVLIVRTLSWFRLDSEIISGSLLPIVAMMEAVNART